MKPSSGEVYPRAVMQARFGDFVLDTEERRFLRAGQEVHLTPKGLALLQYLIERRPHAVSKSEIFERVWPSTFVGDASLNSVVKELRRALGESAREPALIRTVRGFGYAFPAEAQVGAPHPSRSGGPAGAPAPEFRLCWQQREVSLVEGENLLGRTRQAALWVEHISVSRRHACIRVAGGHATIEDCGSKNGTFLRGERVTGPRALRGGDEILLGSASILVHVYPTDTSTASLDPGGR